MTRALRKAMMRRSQLESKYLKTKTELDKNNFKKQKNFVSRFYKKERAKYFKNLDLKSFLENKTFWKNVKPFFSEKGSIRHKISLVDKNEIISDSAKIAEHFKNFFENAVKNLDLPVNDILLNLDVSETDPIDIITEQYASHPSILKIKEKIPSNSNIFSFHEVDQAVIKNEIKNLDSNKATPFGNIPTKDLKRSQEICVPIIQNLFNDSIQTLKFRKT